MQYLTGLPSQAFQPDNIQTRTDQYFFNYSVFAQYLFSGDDKTALRFRDTIYNDMPGDRSLDTKLLCARAHAYLALPDRDANALAARVTDLLNMHAKYSSSEVKSRCAETANWIAYDVMAVKVLAHQRGTPLDIDNKYVPQDLLTTALARS